MRRYVCGKCSHAYDPEAGDRGGGIRPMTSFVDLPLDWSCPVCGAGRAAFAPEEEGPERREARRPRAA